MKKATTKLNAKLINALYKVLDITKEDIIWSKKSHSQKGNEMYQFILSWFIKEDNKVLTMSFTFIDNGKLYVSLNEKQTDWKFITIREVKPLDEVKVLINSRTSFEDLDTWMDLSSELDM